MLSAAIDSVVAEQPVSSEAPPAAAAPAASAPADTPATEPAAQAPTPADDPLIEVVVDGETRQVPLSEARKGYMLQSAFTRKTQDLARQRDAFNAEQQALAQQREALSQREQQLMSLLQDDQKFAAAYMAIRAKNNGQSAGAPQAPQVAPEMVRQQLLAAIAPQVEQQVLARIAQQQHEQQAAHELTSHYQSLVKDHPILSALGDFEDTVMGAVANMRPSTLDEAKQYMQAYLGSVTEKIGTHTDTAAKAAAAAKAKAAAATIPGGGPMPTGPKQYKSPDDPQIDQDILAMLESDFGVAR